MSDEELEKINLESLAQEIESNEKKKLCILDYSTKGVDDHRLELKMTKKMLEEHKLVTIDSSVKKFTDQKFPNLKKSKLTAILSKANGKKQCRHTDLSQETKEGVKLSSFCRILFLAVEDGSEILIYRQNKEIRLSIPKGSLFIIKGNMHHAGVAYLKTNIRCHWYLLIPNCYPSEKLATLISDEDYNEYYRVREDNIKNLKKRELEATQDNFTKMKKVRQN